MDGVLTVDELRTGGLTGPLVDLLPRIDGLVGLRKTAELEDCLRLRWAPCAAEDLVSYHGRPVTNGMRTTADLTRWALVRDALAIASDRAESLGLRGRRWRLQGRLSESW